MLKKYCETATIILKINEVEDAISINLSNFENYVYCALN